MACKPILTPKGQTNMSYNKKVSIFNFFLSYYMSEAGC